MTGYLKMSPNGTKIAHAIGTALDRSSALVELMNFDNSSGIISGPVVQLTPLDFPYGAEFSPDEKLLYVSELIGKRILQYDLGATNINASKQIIATSPNLLYGALQLGPDKKIYIVAENGYNNGYGYLSVINSPNTLGVGCNFAADAVGLNGKTALIGFQNFYQNFFRKLWSLTYNSIVIKKLQRLV